jgi:hypothetical protein
MLWSDERFRLIADAIRGPWPLSPERMPDRYGRNSGRSAPGLQDARLSL